MNKYNPKHNLILHWQEKFVYICFIFYCTKMRIDIFPFPDFILLTITKYCFDETFMHCHINFFNTLILLFKNLNPNAWSNMCIYIYISLKIHPAFEFFDYIYRITCCGYTTPKSLYTATYKFYCIPYNNKAVHLVWCFAYIYSLHLT